MILTFIQKRKQLILINLFKYFMKSKTIFTISGVCVVVLFVIIIFTQYISITNQEVRLRNQFDAEQQKIEMVYDNMWKTIQQTAEVSDKYQESFKDIYVQIMDKRYDKNDGTLMNWIKEANPNFDIRLYDKLATTIEVERHRFLNAQTKAVDIQRIHNNMLDVIPSKWFLGSCPRLEYEVISSSRSKNVMNTRLDDDVSIFNDKK